MNEPLLRSDERARIRALDAGTSFIVQAPAGSGKTELLIQRFLTLLARVSAPEEVVAITFTRKAAGEMRKRVLDALAAVSAGREPENAQQRITYPLAQAALEANERHGWSLIENPARLRILTIDALCLSLSAQMPLLSRMGSVPSPVDEAEELYREAARETVELLADEQWHGLVAALLDHLDNDVQSAQQLLAGLLARRDQWLRHGEVQDREALTQAFVNLCIERVEAVRRLLPPGMPAAMIGLLRFAAARLAVRSPDSPIVQCGALVSLPDATLNDLGLWRAISRWLLTDGADVRKSVDARIGFPRDTEPGITPAEKTDRRNAKLGMQALLATVGETPGLVEALANVRQLPDPRYTDEQWALIESLYALLKPAAMQLAVVFARHGEVDFTELLIAANLALGEPEAPTDLALSLDYRVRHLLIDEFQDTSLSQYELLHRLTAGWERGDGRTLFAVGDPMQSIYRFRQAEVGLFLRARQDGVGVVALEPLKLSCNFRSQGGVVQWVNETFASVLPPREDPGSGAVPYAPSLPRVPALAGEAVHLHMLPHAEGAAEAQRVLDIIRRECAEDPARTIAILVRSRTHLEHIIPALKSAGLRPRAIGIEALGHRPAVQDVHALARALLHPADDVAWIAVLRAPWCALRLLDLEQMAAWGERTTWWARIADERLLESLSEDAQQRLRRLREALEPVLAQRLRGSLRDRIEGAWLRLAGPACVEEPGDLEDVKVYLERVETMERGGDLDDLPGLEAELTRLYAVPDAQAPSQLQVMTIHKAKGLEFDVVIVPGLARASGKDDSELMRWLERPREDGGSDLLLATLPARGRDDDPLYQCVTRLLNERQEHEDARLLYVAATRAKCRLHLTAELKLDPKADRSLPMSPDGRSLLARLWPAIREEAQQRFARELAAAPPAESQAPDPLGYRIRRHVAVPFSPPAPVRWQPVPMSEADRDTMVEFSWAGETARHVGSVVHGFLQRIAQEGLAQWDVARVDAQAALALTLLEQAGVASEQLPGAQGRVLDALRRAVVDARGRWILSAHRDAQCEYRLAGEIDGSVVNVTLDRTFVDERGVRWIIDYKTSVHEGTGREKFLDEERERYRPQLERYARLLARLDARPVRLGLYFPLLEGWREWDAVTRGQQAFAFDAPTPGGQTNDV
jgi:ATP-dependent exoDNAse (exonuclease V) beta subunit